MSEEPRETDETSGRWAALPPHTPLEDTIAGHEVPPKPQAIADSGNRALEEATRYPV